ncbi:hypothetical protein HK101_005042 [Irineochytrium annulatum]|nr:hypothetical protein HK101_005042 [Irineochytrium annulatum]
MPSAKPGQDTEKENEMEMEMAMDVDDRKADDAGGEDEEVDGDGAAGPSEHRKSKGKDAEKPRWHRTSTFGYLVVEALLRHGPCTMEEIENHYYAELKLAGEAVSKAMNLLPKKVTEFTGVGKLVFDEKTKKYDLSYVSQDYIRKLKVDQPEERAIQKLCTAYTIESMVKEGAERGPGGGDKEYEADVEGGGGSEKAKSSKPSRSHKRKSQTPPDVGGGEGVETEKTQSSKKARPSKRKSAPPDAEDDGVEDGSKKGKQKVQISPDDDEDAEEETSASKGVRLKKAGRGKGTRWGGGSIFGFVIVDAILVHGSRTAEELREHYDAEMKLNNTQINSKADMHLDKKTQELVESGKLTEDEESGRFDLSQVCKDYIERMNPSMDTDGILRKIVSSYTVRDLQEVEPGAQSGSGEDGDNEPDRSRRSSVGLRAVLSPTSKKRSHKGVQGAELSGGSHVKRRKETFRKSHGKEVFEGVGSVAQSSDEEKENSRKGLIKRIKQLEVENATLRKFAASQNATASPGMRASDVATIATSNGDAPSGEVSVDSGDKLFLSSAEVNSGGVRINGDSGAKDGQSSKSDPAQVSQNVAAFRDLEVDKAKLEVELTTERQEKQRLKGALASLNAEFDSINAAKKRLEIDKSRLLEELSTVKAECSRLLGSSNWAEKELELAREEVAKFQKDARLNMGQLEEYTKSIEHLRSDRDRLQLRSFQLESEVADTRGSLDASRQRETALAKKSEELASEMAKLNAKIAELHRNGDAFIERIRSLTAEKDRAIQGCDSFKEDMERMRAEYRKKFEDKATELASVESRCTHLATTVNELRLKNDQLSSSLHESVNANSDLKRKFTNELDKTRELEEALALAKESMKELEFRNTHLMASDMLTSGEAERMKYEIEQKTKSIEELECKLLLFKSSPDSDHTTGPLFLKATEEVEGAATAFLAKLQQYKVDVAKGISFSPHV